MLSEADKSWIVKTIGTMLAGFRLPLQNDRDAALKEFASELENLLKPLVSEVVAMREELESLKHGLADAAQEIRQRDAEQADDWWRKGDSTDGE